MSDGARIVLAGLTLFVTACRGVPDPVAAPAETVRTTESFVDPRLSWLARHQNDDGSWGAGAASFGDREVGRPGITAIVVRAFQEGGYSHLSRDDWKGISPGETVKRGVKWLISALAPDGTFPAEGDPALNQILATWALSEAYGLTATSLLKEPAQRAANGFRRLIEDGLLWQSDLHAGWAAHALMSVKLSELEGEWDAKAGNASTALSPRESLQSTAARTILHEGDRSLKSWGELIASQPLDAPPDLPDCYFGATVVSRCEGEGQPWTSYEFRMRQMVRAETEALEKSREAPPGVSEIKASLLSLILFTVNDSPRNYSPQK